MRIASHDLNEKVFVIAEVGNNHEGDFGLAKELIHLARNAGADAVKFQTIKPERLVSVTETARIQRLSSFAFSGDQFRELAAEAKRAGIHFMSTPFDLDAVDLLAPLVPAFKIASGDNDFLPLLDKVARTGKPIVMSAGMATRDEIALRAGFIKSVWAETGKPGDLCLLHCVVSYPASPDQANLGAIRALAGPDWTVGYSDHTIGIDAAVLAVGLGARVIEKHFTISKTHSDFRDHSLSADPGDLAEMIKRIRAAEILLGSGVPGPMPEEQSNLTAARRQIVAARDLAAGTVLAPADFSWVRPRDADGMKPGEEAKLIGKTLAQAIPAGLKITLAQVK